MSPIDSKLHNNHVPTVSRTGSKQADTTQSDSYWLSVDELEQDPSLKQFVDAEFPAQADQLIDPVSRRRFMQLMGASFAMAGAVSCRWEKEEIIPLSRRPEEYIPGKTKKYATAMELGGVGEPVMVTAYDGRPIKVDGNAGPEQDSFGKGSSLFAQASVLGLYDPDRSQRVKKSDGAATDADFVATLRALVAKARNSANGKLGILSEGTSSPSVAGLLAALQTSFPGGVQTYEYEPLSDDNERLGTKQAFGTAVRPMAHLDKAKTIVAIGADILGAHPGSRKYIGDFAESRSLSPKKMSRLYAIESSFTTTGASADHRLPLRQELIEPFLLAVEAKLLGQGIPAVQILRDERVRAFVEEMATDLAESKGKAVFIAGYGQSSSVHALVARINTAIGANGTTLTYHQVVDRKTYAQSITDLTKTLRSGGVDTLLILGGNPVYTAPANLEFAEAITKAKTTIHLSDYYDETSRVCSWHVPRAHYLESWGDSRSFDGRVAISQPIIEPMYHGRTPVELLTFLLSGNFPKGDKVIRETFASAVPFSSGGWRRALHNGFYGSSYPVYPVVSPNGLGAAAPKLTANQKRGKKLNNGELELVFTSSPHTYDGRFANNGWLQETPDFMTKLTWGNAALISPLTAQDLGIRNSEIVTIKKQNAELEVPVYVMPGQAPYSISLSVGYGRTVAGRVGGDSKNGVEVSGVNAFVLRDTDSLDAFSGVTVTGTGRLAELASVQDHWDYRFQQGRQSADNVGRKGIEKRLPELVRTVEAKHTSDIIPAAQLLGKREKEEYPNGRIREVAEVTHKPADAQLFGSHEYDGNKWGMAIDLSRCVGCNACTVACQSENNVPIVGKEQVRKSREMHWIRIDRYFQGDMENPSVRSQPMHCQQCENAPCEQVCPVGATIHSSEGLNDMVYNRCVGTRYCLNNCPYKVRRFNFLNWHKDLDTPMGKVKELSFNPEVTVRSRGVMEKCTWCVQRIQAAKIDAKNARKVEGKRRLIEDGTITTACQDACPASAIVFGDLNDKDSAVTKAHADPRAYELLDVLETRPRNRFLARVTNPNPALKNRLAKL